MTFDTIMTLSMSILTAFCFSLIAIKVMKQVAVNVGLVDTPNERKKHSGQIPLVGGISIFIAVLFASSIWLPNSQELRIYQIASAMMVFIGALDDKYDLSVKVRIVAQIIVASLLIYGVGSYIHEFGNLFLLGNIDIGFLGIPFTYLAILAAINAFNMVDGIDGLLGSLSINAFATIALLLLINESHSEISYPLIVGTAILPYLYYNVSTRQAQSGKKLFMGDAGSMFIGLSVVWILALTTQGETSEIRPVMALYVIAIPLMDMLAIIVRRVRKGKSPFKPDRDHLHHIFMRSGFSDREALVIITLIAITISSIGIIGEILMIPEAIMFMLFVAMFSAYAFAIKHIWKVSKVIRRIL